jgi:hypothetical protein
MGFVKKLTGKDQKPPPAPDFGQAAQAQGQANMDTARLQTEMNRPNEFTPFGSRTWTKNGDQWTSNVTMSPQVQGLYDKSIAGANNSLAQPFDITNNRDAIVDAMYRRSTRLMDPQYQQSEEQQRSDLVNRGFSVGDEGYTRAMDNFNRMKSEDYANARDRATTGGAQQAVSEALVQRQEPLQELNAIRTGAMPTFQPYSATSNISPAPTFAATQAQWGADMDRSNFMQAQNAGMMSGLFGLGASYLGSGGRFGF